MRTQEFQDSQRLLAESLSPTTKTTTMIKKKERVRKERKDPLQSPSQLETVM